MANKTYRLFDRIREAGTKYTGLAVNNVLATADGNKTVIGDTPRATYMQSFPGGTPSTTGLRSDIILNARNSVTVNGAFALPGQALYIVANNGKRYVVQEGSLSITSDQIYLKIYGPTFYINLSGGDAPVATTRDAYATIPAAAVAGSTKTIKLLDVKADGSQSLWMLTSDAKDIALLELTIGGDIANNAFALNFAVVADNASCAQYNYQRTNNLTSLYGCTHDITADTTQYQWQYTENVSSTRSIGGGGGTLHLETDAQYLVAATYTAGGIKKIYHHQTSNATLTASFDGYSHSYNQTINGDDTVSVTVSENAGFSMSYIDTNVIYLDGVEMFRSVQEFTGSNNYSYSRSSLVKQLVFCGDAAEVFSDSESYTHIITASSDAVTTSIGTYGGFNEILDDSGGSVYDVACYGDNIGASSVNAVDGDHWPWDHIIGLVDTGRVDLFYDYVWDNSDVGPDYQYNETRINNEVTPREIEYLNDDRYINAVHISRSNRITQLDLQDTIYDFNIPGPVPTSNLREPVATPGGLKTPQQAGIAGETEWAINPYTNEVWKSGDYIAYI